MLKRHLFDERRNLYDMRGRVDMGGVVHAGRDALRQHPRLRHVMNALDLDVFEIRPVRRLESEAMREIVELQPIALSRLPWNSMPRICIGMCLLILRFHRRGSAAPLISYCIDSQYMCITMQSRRF